MSMGEASQELREKARALIAASLVWDAHVCLPLHPDADLLALERHRRSGFDFVSVNIGMDLNPADQILPVLASFRAQIAGNAEGLFLARSAGDVETARAEGRLAVAFDLEGGLVLQGRPEMVALLGELGVRQIHLAYNRNNQLAGGCYDEDMRLTDAGRRIVQAINAAGIFMDCSHTGERTSLDIINASSDPVIFSHSNARALHDDARNITDEQIDACAATGGVVCVNGIGRFLGDDEARSPAIVQHIDYFVQRVGPRHVGLGIDYAYPANGLDEDPPGLDRDYWWPPAHGYVGGLNVRMAAPEQLSEIVEGLVERGYAEKDIRDLLGGNMLRLARRVWCR